ncbi:hypothetical protein [Weissella minor]|uniref:hypothetical protein n=1 Tax=Weissella minor TaxID=1620 RepID=UPI003AF2B02E
MSEEKMPWYIKIIVFSLVPISQILLYFVAGKYVNVGNEISTLQKSLNMTSSQLLTFEILSVLLFSLLSFGFMYLLIALLLKVFSKNPSYEPLFVALVLTVGVSNSAAIIVTLILHESVATVPAILQLILSMGLYYNFSNKDKIGTIIVGTVYLIFSVIPAFL